MFELNLPCISWAGRTKDDGKDPVRQLESRLIVDKRDTQPIHGGIVPVSLFELNANVVALLKKQTDDGKDPESLL